MNKRFVIITCLMVLLIGGSSVAYTYTKTPASYLSLDINPSVEIGVNTLGKVVKAEGYNNDGKKILNGINVKGSDVKEAINTLVLSAIKNGFIEKDGSTVISLTSETDNSNTATKLEADAEIGVNEALKEDDITAVVQKDNVALARREEAKTLGITPGKLNLIKKLQAVDPTATLEQYKDSSVKDIMLAIKNNTDHEAKNNKDKKDLNNTDNGDVNNIDNNNVNNSNSDSKDKINNNNNDNKDNVNNSNSDNKDKGNNSNNDNKDNVNNSNSDNKDKINNSNNDNKDKINNSNSDNKDKVNNSNSDNKDKVNNGNSDNKDKGKGNN